MLRRIFIVFYIALGAAIVFSATEAVLGTFGGDLATEDYRTLMDAAKLAHNVGDFDHARRLVHMALDFQNEPFTFDRLREKLADTTTIWVFLLLIAGALHYIVGFQRSAEYRSNKS